MTRYAIALGAAVLALFAAYWHGVTTTETEWQLIMEREVGKARDAQLLAEQTARKKERDADDKAAAIEAEYHAKRQADEAEFERLAADLSAGAIRLRDKFRCAPASASGMSTAATSPAASAERGSGGLQKQDEDFLVRESARADKMTRERNECVALLNQKPL